MVTQITWQISVLLNTLFCEHSLFMSETIFSAFTLYKIHKQLIQHRLLTVQSWWFPSSLWTSFSFAL